MSERMWESRIARKAMEIMDQVDPSIADPDGTLLDLAALAAWHALTPGHHETLLQLLNMGPVYDGDIVSKAHRGDLLKLGLAVRCCFKGEQGYTAASYRAYTIYHAGMATR